ncbi:MAG: hypothetical protein KGP14_13775 [Betaproteobacteria bacterium]|nr:hypothetical protein [Betaproteobacteria bacterium]
MDDLAEHDDALEEKDTSADVLAEVYKRAMRRFDESALATRENRAHSLEARRFVSIPGAQWEGPWGEQFDNAIKLEVNKVGRGVQKIERDYRENRIVPDFRPDGKAANPETAETLAGIWRADDYRFKSQQARDNAVFEAIAGGFGAYRLTTEWEDEGDKDNDHQRINPASIIVDADQTVFFDIGARLYDKSDANFVFVRCGMTTEAFTEEYEGAATTFPDGAVWKVRDWFRPDMVFVAEYYEREEVTDTLWILKHRLSGEEKRLWASEIERGTLAQLEADGWAKRRQTRKRCRVHKYILSGAEVLEDCGLIAFECLPVVPVYGQRYFVDGIERWKGYVQDKMDPQRLYNSSVSKIAETNALAPREVPIFAPEQMDPVISEQWARLNIDRLPYALAHPLTDSDGNISHVGPVGKVEPPQVSPAQAAQLQIANADLTEDQQDGSEQVRANTSAEAMDIAATRIDAKSGIYLDNIRQSVQREGEIYVSGASVIYAEDGREVETMDEEGDDGSAILFQTVTNKDNGEAKVINDLTTGRYKVIVSVTEKTATRRDKTVKSMLHTAEVANLAGDAEMAQAAVITAALNQDGEGMTDFHAWLRKRALGMGLVTPTEDEAKAMEEQAQSQQPDAMTQLAQAQAADFEAAAQKKQVESVKVAADTELTKAKTIETLHGLGQAAANDVVPIAHRKLDMTRHA